MEIKFVKTTNLLEEPQFQNFYSTSIDGNFVGMSGSHNYDKAYEKYNLLVTNAGITTTTEIIEKIILD